MEVCFKKVIVEIKENQKLSDSQIATITSTTQSTIQRLRTGDIFEPKYKLGVKLIRLNKNG